MRTLLLLQLSSTLCMTGVIWFVQVVHYPLFGAVGNDAFADYERSHANRTTVVVAPLMVLEFASALLLLVPRLRPGSVPATGAWLGAVLVGVLWASTGLVQVPLHNRLHAGYDGRTIGRLVRSNWVRTAVWTLRAGLVLSWCRLR